MSQQQQYKQCQLTKETNDGTAFMVSWIRSELAHIGKTIDRLEDTETGVVEMGWKVMGVSDRAYPENLLMYRSHRPVFGSLEANKTKKEKRQAAN